MFREYEIGYKENVGGWTIRLFTTSLSKSGLCDIVDK